MRDFNPAIENLMKFTPTDSVIRSEPSSYTAHKGWFQVTGEVKEVSSKRTKNRVAKR